ncbi:glycosyltransferase [Candidatus Daviesbacteria bacterium]|nr:glycosyltransferase [Candidatus Daviesbacteria bacterium]
MKLALSIVIPTLNEEKYLPSLLNSIQNQTKLPKEIIIADAKSSDQTRKIARDFKCKLVDGGLPSVARNNGAKAAKEKLILFLDADILLSRSFLEVALLEMRQKKLDVASCFGIPLSSARIDKIIFRSSARVIKLAEKISPRASTPCLFIKKSLHQQIDGFDESVVHAEDHDYVKRAAKIGKFAYLKGVKVLISTRRFSKEGRLKLALKYAISEMHQTFVGPIRKDIFKYEFGNYEE